MLAEGGTCKEAKLGVDQPVVDINVENITKVGEVRSVEEIVVTEDNDCEKVYYWEGFQQIELSEGQEGIEARKKLYKKLAHKLLFFLPDCYSRIGGGVRHL